MKAYDITKLTAKLKSNNVQYRNKKILLFWSADLVLLFIVLSLILYLSLLGVGKYRLLMNSKLCSSLKVI